MIKKKKFFIFTSHRPTIEQEREIKEKYNAELVFLPVDLQSKFSNIPAEGDLTVEHVSPLSDFLIEKGQQDDFVWIQGEPGLSYFLITFCRKIKMIPVYATTKRKFENIILDDGSSKNIHYFKHVNFREYPFNLIK